LSRGGRGLHRPFFRHKHAQNGLLQPDPPLTKPACRSSLPRSLSWLRPRLPTLRPGYPSLRSEARVPSLPVRFASGISALRSARALPDTLPLVGAIPGGSALASLTRWQSASTTPPRAGRRFLLVLSGGPGRKRLRRRIYILFRPQEFVSKLEISIDLRIFSPRSAPQSGLVQPCVIPPSLALVLLLDT